MDSIATISHEEHFMIPKEICETEEAAMWEAMDCLHGYMREKSLDTKFKLSSIKEAMDEKHQPYWLVTFTPVNKYLTIN